MPNQSNNTLNRKSIILLNTQLKNLTLYGTLFGAFALLSMFQSNQDSVGVYSLLPVTLTVIIAIVTKKALEAILACSSRTSFTRAIKPL